VGTLMACIKAIHFYVEISPNLAQRYYIHEVKSIELTARLVLG
jgi:hypothetical protein